MKIAVLGNVDKEISLNTKGGSELFTYLLSSNLAHLPGVEKIHVFGVGGDNFHDGKIAFHSLLPQATRAYVRDNPFLNELMANRPDAFMQIEAGLAAVLAERLTAMQEDIDLIHNNATSAVFNSFLPVFKKPVLTTLHTNASSPSILVPLGLNKDLLSGKSRYFATVADHQKKYIADNNIPLPVIGTVYNGIDVSAYPFAPSPADRSALWIGRVSSKHNKGLLPAIEAAHRSGKRLQAYGFVDDKEYFEREVQPHLAYPETTLHLEDLSFEEKRKAYQQAGYFLYPIMWEEPFGLVFLEAMASGAPVIAFARGAVPEIIRDGVTGFIVNPSPEDIRGDWIVKKTGIDGIAEAMERMHSLSDEEYATMRRESRQLVEEHFTAKIMAGNYFALYERILQMTPSQP